jgi:hydrogenase maturation protease
MNTLVLGIGNTLLKDEGAGVHAIRYLCGRYPPSSDTQYMDGGTLSFTLAAHIENAQQLVVIDAAQLNSSAGSVHAFIGSQMDDFLHNNTAKSVHEVSLFDLMSMVRLTGRLPRHRALVGIQPREVNWGEKLSGDVEAAIPVACGETMRILQEWRT